MSEDRPIVLCIRHPDYSNEYVTDPGVGDPHIVDVDLGASDLSDPEELSEWLECMSVEYNALRPGHCQRRLEQLLDVLQATRGNIMADGVS